MPMCRSPPFLSKNADKKEMEEIKCQKNITFMSTDKGLKSVSRYIKSTGEYSGRFYTACPVMETVDSGMMETAIPEMQNQ